MTKNSYPLHFGERRETFEFESIGPKGVIIKVIEFSFMAENLWNLAFGDKIDDDWSDSIVSNNEDLVRVISTVAKAVFEFSDRWPTRQIYIEPVDEKRKRLYHSIFHRHFETIELDFQIFGLANEKADFYDSALFYDAFILLRKSN